MAASPLTDWLFDSILIAYLIIVGTAWNCQFQGVFTRSNGITEGFHNKMETISRVGYGLRNFQNYRLRVKVLCSFGGVGFGAMPVVGVEPF